MGMRGKLRTIADNQLGWWCAGCEELHVVTVGSGETWQWNGSYDKPTFKPSVLVRSGHYCSTHKPGDACWCTFNEKRKAEGKEPSRFECRMCHTFVTDGMVQYLGDCTHALVNQTVELPQLPEHMRT